MRSKELVYFHTTSKRRCHLEDCFTRALLITPIDASDKLHRAALFTDDPLHYPSCPHDNNSNENRHPIP